MLDGVQQYRRIRGKTLHEDEVAIEAKKHIYCEKPAGVDLEGVKRETKMLKIIGSFALEVPDPPAPESPRVRGGVGRRCGPVPG